MILTTKFIPIIFQDRKTFLRCKSLKDDVPGKCLDNLKDVSILEFNTVKRCIKTNNLCIGNVR